ncbi:MAG: hypothetical protein LUF85_10640 [Bacteroides sp.]|nr:hypothetical protein [Bacteroides sp.]
MGDIYIDIKYISSCVEIDTVPETSHIEITHTPYVGWTYVAETHAVRLYRWMVT